MLRVFLFVLVPVLLPSAIYLVWLLATRRRRAAEGEPAVPPPTQGLWLWTALAGAGFMVTILVLQSLDRPDQPGGAYTPPRLIDGEVSPAQTER